MFRRDTFVLLAVALLGVVLVFYLAIAQTPFFPRSLYTKLTDCPERVWEFPPFGEYPVPADRRPVLDEFEAREITSVLLALGEHPLHRTRNDEGRTVRLTVLNGLGGNMAIRLIQTDGGGQRLVGKRMPAFSTCRTASECEVDRMLTLAEQTRLEAAETPLLQRASFGCTLGLVDGSDWLIEASGGGDYRAWHSWSPQDPDIRRLGDVMLDLTGW